MVLCVKKYNCSTQGEYDWKFVFSFSALKSLNAFDVHIAIHQNILSYSTLLNTESLNDIKNCHLSKLQDGFKYLFCIDDVTTATGLPQFSCS